MERFRTRYQDRIAGIFTGFDRRLFRGTLRLYRAHGLIAKVAHSHPYRVTPKGQHTALRGRTASLQCFAA